MTGLGLVIATFFVHLAPALGVQGMDDSASPPVIANPVVVCDEIETARMFVHSTSKPEYYKLKLPSNLILLPGTFNGIEARNQDDEPVPDLGKTLFARLDRVAPFYDEIRVVPPSPEFPQARQEHVRVFAVSLYLKSTVYDLDWKEGNGYRYLDKEMRRNLFCELVSR